MPGGGGPHRGLPLAALQLQEGVALPPASAYAGRPGGASDLLLEGSGEMLGGDGAGSESQACSWNVGFFFRYHRVWFHTAPLWSRIFPPQDRAAS